MHSHRDLKVWQEAVSFVKNVYEVTKMFPKEEQYALTDQLRRAVVSIPSNIAEGQRRRSSREFLQFTQIAFGSAAEADTQIEIAFQLKYITHEKYVNLLEQLTYISKMLNKLSSALQTTA